MRVGNSLNDMGYKKLSLGVYRPTHKLRNCIFGRERETTINIYLEAGAQIQSRLLLTSSSIATVVGFTYSEQWLQLWPAQPSKKPRANNCSQ